MSSQVSLSADQGRHCCETMARTVTHDCEQHSNPFDCPDYLIHYSAQFDEYGLVIHDGGPSCVMIGFCPFCGLKLPESRRYDWFDRLEALGFDNPFDQQIPEKFKSAAWRLNEGK